MPLVYQIITNIEPVQFGTRLGAYDFKWLLSGNGASTSSSSSSTSRRIELNVTEFVQWFKWRLDSRLIELHALRLKCQTGGPNCQGEEINFVKHGSHNFVQLLQNLEELGKRQDEARGLAKDTDESTKKRREEMPGIQKAEEEGGGAKEGRVGEGSAEGGRQRSRTPVLPSSRNSTPWNEGESDGKKERDSERDDGVINRAPDLLWTCHTEQDAEMGSEGRGRGEKTSSTTKDKQLESSYPPCFLDVRQAVISWAKDQKSLVLQQRQWRRVFASQFYIQTTLADLTIKKEGWHEFQAGETCRILPHLGLPPKLNNVSCTLIARVDGKSDWRVFTCDSSVETTKLEVNPCHLGKIHGEADDFESLQNGCWMGGEVFNCFMGLMCRSMGWGYSAMPPTRTKIAGKRQVWVATSHLLLAQEFDDPSNGLNRGVSGMFKPNKLTPVSQESTEASKTLEQTRTEAVAEMREAALSVTDAIITVNDISLHWTWASVSFENCLITLDDPCGAPQDLYEIKKRPGIVCTLRKLQRWAVSMQAAREEKSRPFTFRVRVTRTQHDDHQCGPHTTANILLFAGNVDDKRASTVVAQDMRLWVAYMLWLHGDTSISLPSMTSAQLALHNTFASRDTHADNSENRSTCAHVFMELFLNRCSQSGTGADGLQTVSFSKQFDFPDLEISIAPKRYNGGGKRPAVSQAPTIANLAQPACLDRQRPVYTIQSLTVSKNVKPQGEKVGSCPHQHIGGKGKESLTGVAAGRGGQAGAAGEGGVDNAGLRRRQTICRHTMAADTPMVKEFVDATSILTDLQEKWISARIDEDGIRLLAVSKQIQSNMMIYNVEQMKALDAELKYDPPTFFREHPQFFVVIRADPSWPDANKGEGGAKLFIVLSYTEDGIPVQVLETYAQNTNAFLAPHRERVNGKDAKQFVFGITHDAKQMDFAKFGGMIPGNSWSKTQFRKIPNMDIRRTQEGAQDSICSSVSFCVDKWKGKEGNHLEGLMKQMRKDKLHLKMDGLIADVSRASKLIKTAQATMCTTLTKSSMSMRLQKVPPDGDCWMTSVNSSTMQSADPKHAEKFHNTLFPPGHHHTPLHATVIQDNLVGCARLWFARWMCLKNNVRDIYATLCQKTHASVEASEFYPSLPIGAFLDFVAKPSSMSDGQPHWFDTPLMYYYMLFLSDVLATSVVILSLDKETMSSKNTAIKSVSGHALLYDKTKVRDAEELRQSHFVVVFQNSVGEHYDPVLFDYQFQDNFWAMRGFMTYSKLPDVLKRMLTLNEIDKYDCTKSPCMYIHHHGLEPTTEEEPLLLFCGSRKIDWKAPDNRIAFRMLTFQHCTPNLALNINVGLSFLIAPLICMGAVGGYDDVNAENFCRKMFTAPELKQEHYDLCAKILIAMARLLECLLNATQNRQHAEKNGRKRDIEGIQHFISFALPVPDKSSKDLVLGMCACFHIDDLQGKHIFGISLHLFFSLYATLVNRTIVVANDQTHLWDPDKQTAASDVTGVRYVPAGKVFRVLPSTAKMGESSRDPGKFECVGDVKSIMSRLEGLDKASKKDGTFVGRIPFNAELSLLSCNQALAGSKGTPQFDAHSVSGEWSYTQHLNGKEGHIIISSSDWTQTGMKPCITAMAVANEVVANPPKPLFLHDEKSHFQASAKSFQTHITNCLHYWHVHFNGNDLQLLSYVMGWTGFVPKCKHENMQCTLNDLATVVRGASQAEINTWLAHGGSDNCLTTDHTSSDEDRANVLTMWFLGTQVQFLNRESRKKVHARVDLSTF